MTALHACLAAGITAGICQALPGDFHPPPPPPLPAYATQQWIHYAASIAAGETVPGCEICHLWIACTIKRDIERGHHPWALHPGRWHGYRTPSPTHLTAIEAALHPQGCLDVPTCAYLGNLNDYRYWASGLAQGVPSHIVGNRHGAIVCIPSTGELPHQQGNSLTNRGTPSSTGELPHQQGNSLINRGTPSSTGELPHQQGNSLINRGTPSPTGELPHQQGNSLTNRGTPSPTGELPHQHSPPNYRLHPATTRSSQSTTRSQYRSHSQHTATPTSITSTCKTTPVRSRL